FVFNRGETAAVAGRDFEPAAEVLAFVTYAGCVIVTQRHQPTFVVEGSAHDSPRVELVDGTRGGFLNQEGQQTVFLHMQTRQQVGEGVAAANDCFADEGVAGRGF